MHDLIISISRKIAYTLAGLIILAALLSSISRLIVPVLDAHRADFEKWTSDLLSLPVTIDRVRVSWYQYQPEITLNEVTILNKEAKRPILQIGSVRIFFSLSQSLWQRKPVPSRIMVSNVDVNLHQNQQGEISVQGFPVFGGFNNHPYENETKFSDMMGWLSAQPKMSLENIDVRYTPFSGQKRFVSLYRLSLENNGQHHRLTGKVLLHQELPTEMTMHVQWQGANADLNKINGQAYFYISGLSLAQWLQDSTWQDWKVKQGIASVKLWMFWNQGQWQKIQSVFRLYNLNLYSMTDKSWHVINRLSGELGWRREGQKQIMAGQDILIDLPTHLWPVTHFYLSLSPDEQKNLIPNKINMSYFNIDDIQSLILSSSQSIKAPWKTIRDRLQITGALQNININFATPWTDWQASSFNIGFNDLVIKGKKNIPEFRHLSGVLSWQDRQGRIDINSNKAEFIYPKLFLKEINLNQLQSSVNFKQEANQDWLLDISNLSILNDDAGVNLHGRVRLPATWVPDVDLQANITVPKANHITRYLPMKLYDPELIAWLEQAFLAGDVPSGQLQLRGSLDQFPFDKNNGLFSIICHVNNVDLHYAPDWPNLRRIQGLLTFTGRRLTIDINHAELQGISIGKVQGIIPYLGDMKPQILEIQSEPIATDLTKGLYFIHNSPLEKTFGTLFKEAKLNGPMTLKLGLRVPLKDPNDTKVSGVVGISNALFTMVPWHLSIEKLNGELQFTEDAITAKNLYGELFQKPLMLNLATIKKAKNNAVVRVGVNANININDLEKWLDVSLSSKVRGETMVQGDIDFSLHEPISLTLQSELQGITVDVAGDYAKTAEQARAFTLYAKIDEKKPLQLQLGYGNLLSAAFKLERKENKFTLLAANLRLGKGIADWPSTNGLYISGEFAELSWDNIKQYIEQSTASYTALPLRSIDVRVRSLQLLGQKLTNTHWHIMPKQNQWDIDLDSAEVVGHILTPIKIQRSDVVVVDFSKLKLRSTGSSNATIINLKSLPSIVFTANNTIYNDMPLGKVGFKLSPVTNGMNIDNLNVSSSKMQVRANGSWSQANNKNITRLKGNASSDNVSALLSNFGFDVGNFIASKGKFDFNLSWRNAPFAPELASMNGDSKLELGEGRIIDVGQTSGAKMDLGKMLSIFSLQSIPKRLTFDFSDVFQKGYSFDSLTGDFILKNGDAYTSNTRFEGSIATVTIHGRIGLLKKDYDFVLSVTPHITSSVPVAATLITLNPLVGVAAYAVNKVVSSAVSQATTYYYTVTGSWANPIYKPM